MSGHLPNVQTEAGLHDVMALGNLCEIGLMLKRALYTEAVDADMVEEWAAACWHY